MPNPTTAELKRTLRQEGFEIYRTQGERVVLADRVRDNLIMDSGVAAGTGEALSVRVVLRSQSSHFPGEGADELLDRARGLAVHFSGRGYAEAAAEAVPVKDPGDPSEILDTWYEVSLERTVSSLPDLLLELRFALGQPKTVGADH